MGNRLTVLLLVLVLGLCAVVAAQLHYLARPAAPIAARAAATPAMITSPAPAAVSMPPLAALTQTVERPVFSPTRRPEVAAQVEVEEAPSPASPAAQPPPALQLSAVVIEAGRQLALFRHASGASGAATLRATTGESVAGWTLVEVRSDGVTLERGGQQHEIPLRTFEPAPVRPEPAMPRDAPGQAAPAPAVSPAQRPRRPVRGPRQHPTRPRAPG